MRAACVALALAVSLMSCSGDSGFDAGEGIGPFSANELHRVVEAVRAHHGLPGLAVLIQQGDEPPLIAVAGVRKLGDDTPIEESDLWFIGSTAKAMTATLLATLVSAGAVEFDTTLREIFPEHAARFTEQTRRITVAHLLSHSAGVSANPAGSPAQLVRLLAGVDDLPAQRELILTLGVSASLQFDPGTDYAYSNTGYILAGAVIERLGGRDYEALLAERVFAPLGIARFGFGHPASAPAQTAGIVDQPWGHRPSFFRLLPVASDDATHVNPGIFNPAGNLYISLVDWARFVRDQLRGRKGQGVLFEPSIYETLQLPADGKTGYSNGWGVLVEDGVPVMLTHNGSDGNWYADVRAYPSTDVVLLIATNDGREDGAAKEAVADIRRIFNRRYSPVP